MTSFLLFLMMSLKIFITEDTFLNALLENIPAGAGVEKRLSATYRMDTKDAGRYILPLMMKEIVSPENIL